MHGFPLIHFQIYFPLRFPSPFWQRVSDFFLGAQIAQLRAEGWSVFRVIGTLPQVGQSPLVFLVDRSFCKRYFLVSPTLCLKP